MAVAGELTFEEGTVPQTPNTSHWKAFFGTDGLRIVDDAGNEYRLMPTALLTPEDVTADNTLTAAEMLGGKIFTNIGDDDAQEQFLPAGAVGLAGSFLVCVAQNMVITPQAGNAIYYSGGKLGDGVSLTSNEIGSRLDVVGLSTGDWFAMDQGTWV